MRHAIALLIFLTLGSIRAGTLLGQEADRTAGAAVLGSPLGKFIHIPGPNPILRPGDEKAWDGGMLECCDVFKDGQTYYLYYHALPRKGNKQWSHKYRTGVAMAQSPLGPWKKYFGNPILTEGPERSCDGSNACCVSVLKEREKSYYLWYFGNTICLATASHPLGPWKKYEKNPLLGYIGYLCNVVKAHGKYWMYFAMYCPQYSGKVQQSPDEGPMGLATAERPEGPWTIYPDNPVLPAGDSGAWDDGAYSEAKVLFHEGAFHWFYGGTKWTKLESIGYAYSFDGIHFTKYPGNPIGMRERNPMPPPSPRSTLRLEPPLVYAFHTLRYKSKGGEDLGVQVFVTQTPFQLGMPLLDQGCLPAKAATTLEDSPPLCLSSVVSAVLTVECRYGAKATRPLLVHVRSSHDGISYDTVDWQSFDNPLRTGELARRSVPMDARVRFVKVLVENRDPSQGVSDVKIHATLGVR